MIAMTETDTETRAEVQAGVGMMTSTGVGTGSGTGVKRGAETGIGTLGETDISTELETGVETGVATDIGIETATGAGIGTDEREVTVRTGHMTDLVTVTRIDTKTPETKAGKRKTKILTETGSLNVMTTVMKRETSDEVAWIGDPPALDPTNGNTQTQTHQTQSTSHAPARLKRTGELRGKTSPVTPEGIESLDMMMRATRIGQERGLVRSRVANAGPDQGGESFLLFL